MAPSPPRLRAPDHAVCPRAVTWWTLRSVLGTLVLLAVQGAAAGALAAAGVAVAVPAVTAGVTVVAGVAHALVVPRLRFRLHRWEQTDDAVHTLAGWLRLQWRIAPISRIQTVDTEQGPLQRVLRLSTLTVTTASASGPLRLDGLDVEEAADLADRLTKATEALGGDAT